LVLVAQVVLAALPQTVVRVHLGALQVLALYYYLMVGLTASVALVVIQVVVAEVALRRRVLIPVGANQTRLYQQ
jgi:hypothetical protein